MSEKAEKKLLTIAEAHQILQKIDIEKADQIQKRTLDYTAEVREGDPPIVAKKLQEGA